MFTVIIAQEEYVEKVQQYELFLRPFLESEDVKFCKWNTEGQRLSEMVPDLAGIVGRRKEWRAVILSDEEGLNKQNPFDLVDQKPEPFTGEKRGADSVLAKEGDREGDESGPELTNDQLVDLERNLDYIYSDEYKAYLEQEHRKKLAAYEQAATKSLTRLVTFFCNGPTVTKGSTSSMAEKDSDYRRYVAESQRKKELRSEILGTEIMEIAQPKEVLCIAKRTYECDECEYDTLWSVHTEAEYSRFYDRNMYFDKMRYLVFDILPKEQRDYSFDYIRYMYATILLATNTIPNSCLSAERVYSLECENDEHALRVLLQTYDAKLDATKEMLKQRIREIHQKKPLTLTDSEAARLFDSRVEQTVVLDDSVKAEDLYAKPQLIGLANGCSRNEEVVWEEEYSRSRRTLNKMLKQTRRALKRAATAAQSQQDVPIGNVLMLNEFQKEDVQDFVDAQELEMLRVDTVDLYNEEAMAEQMEAADKEVKEKIKTRMFRGTTLAVGGVACGAFLLGFFTVFLNFKNAQQNFFNFGTTLILLGVLMGLFAVGAIVTLFFLRSGLTGKFREYNEVVHGVDVQLHQAMGKYTKYLTHACNMRRGYGVLNAVQESVNPDVQTVTLYMKHIADMERAKDENKDVFGQFMVGKKDVRHEDATPYTWNFDKAEDYQYPLPYTEGTVRKITFVQSGVEATVPVDFVKRIVVRREELYE